MTGRTDSDGAVLAAFGIGEDELLGRGGEATVYALDEERALRVLHAGSDGDQLGRTRSLLHRLVGSVSFQLPEILEIEQIAGRV